MPKVVQMRKRPPKPDDGKSAPDDLSALMLPDLDEESLSVAKINKWITLADIALGQGVGRKIA
jgi:hypothetical protein